MGHSPTGDIYARQPVRSTDRTGGDDSFRRSDVTTLRMIA